jgi:WD40 repeat protein
MSKQLRIFISSPGDVRAAREIAALTIERLAQEYARFFKIEPYLWEYEAMIASGHFQDSIEPPSAFDIVVLILWSRLGILLPERTAVRDYRGIDGRAPLTGTEWEFEEALQAARNKGTPDLLVYRSLKPASFDISDPKRREQQLQQVQALDRFWARHFGNQEVILGAYTSFASDAEFAAILDQHLHKLIEKRLSSASSTQRDRPDRVWLKAPFRGLEAYEFEHAPILFGQDEALAKAMLQLTANAEAGSPFLLMLGASGSGKSSLVKAGILPKLFVPRRIPGVAFLRRVVFRPSDARDGEDLFDALARRLTTQISEHEGLSELIEHGQTCASLTAHLRHATGAPGYPIGTALGQLTVRARQEGSMLEYEDAKLVLVIDQLEELFTDEGLTADERRRFVELLAGLARSGLVWIIATMRKDFWHRADETPELVRLSEEGRGRLELLPPTPSQLSHMIRRPAEAAGISFELHPTTNVPLNELIAEEVAREPGALPLLSYLLDQLYRTDVLEAEGDTLTYAAFDRLGRLEGAIATQAETVLARCTAEDRQALGSVLFSLVQMGTAQGDIDHAVARRVPLSAFTPGTPARHLVDALLDPDARLLVSDAEKGRSPTVRVAHEALITHWAQAREFVQRNATALKIRRRIEERYALWRAIGGERDASETDAPRSTSWRARWGREPGLLTDIDLADGRRLLQEHLAETEPHLVTFIERSAADDRRLRTRSVRMLAIVAGVVALLAIVASGAGWIASQKQHEAEAQAARTREAESRLLIETAAARLKDGNITGAQGIILQVLSNAGSERAHDAAAVSVFQEVRAADFQIGVLSGHGATVWSASYSPDGTRIVTASDDKTARIWDAYTGAPFAVLAHSEVAAYSPDGTRIVTAADDGSVRIWDARTGAQLVTVAGHAGTVFSASYSPDGMRIATAGRDNTVRIWDSHSGALLTTLSGHGAPVYAAGFSPDGTRVVSASDDNTARIWDARSGAQLRVLAHSDGVRTSAYSPDGTRIVTADDKRATIWDARSGMQLGVLGESSGIRAAAYSPDGSRIVTASYDKTARIWDARSLQQVTVLSGHSGGLQSAAYSPDGTRIVTASDDQTARVWDAHSDGTVAVLTGHGSWLGTAVFSPDGNRVLTSSDDKTARIWDARSGVGLTILSGHGATVYTAAYSPDGTRAVTASLDKTARIWDTRSGAMLAVLAGHSKVVTSAAYSPDGTRVVTASGDNTARIWDAQTGAQIKLLSGHGDVVNNAAYSPDGTRIVTASWDKTARIWDAHTGIQLDVLAGDHGRLQFAGYSPDGTRIVTTSDDNTARVWDARTGGSLAVLSGHNDLVNAAGFSPDGASIATASLDRTARIWDVQTGAQLAVLAGHSNWVMTAAFSPDGAHIVTASFDKTARIWDARVAAGLDAQILWDESAQIEPLTDIERSRLGLDPDPSVRRWPANSSKCDHAAAAPYDPDRLAPGVLLPGIAADVAKAACLEEVAKSPNSPRLIYQLGRALWANQDVPGARRQFEQGVALGYHASGVDLASLLLQNSVGGAGRERAVSLNEQAWSSGVTAAAFQLGRLFESNSPTDLSKTWSWYQKGADAGEPQSLARLAERDEQRAVAETSLPQQRTLLLHAFAFYAAAAECARDEGWPDDAWRNWRYHRATLARLLARAGMMQQVADSYAAAAKRPGCVRRH